ncbi:hypothetical protein CHGG_07458 [Chaetomium globosum CBS 148.51]|uniref:Aflatoxin biosynthesis ketoreductase nor-1 n=1 Tax=Chaetomium globosum (strain ATCC 6205 / CBS 148.51 / DSM 1962 / NBRC 6347 / NRRL 1970) TaxID=306901 RepID=Q2GX46_CHAGB|nr:uncharacterized protein CHGG_07458 [Chaetomium globosum CBS 148.51]EAQ86205.1 hypothetical protein CHGG_07458 [Chaetomium globosum CBS 148.51]
MPPLIVLITGGNRGLGQGLVKLFLAQPNYTVIAAVRDPNHTTAQALADLPQGAGSTLITVRYDAGSEQSATDAVSELQTKHNIDHLDIVVANAGISKQWPLVKDVKRADIQEHVEVNVLGVVSLYQATRELLQRSTVGPRFAAIGSMAGSLREQPPVPSGSYGPSKAMLNWYGIRINAEEEWLTAFILDPGWVQTEMGNRAAQVWGVAEAAPDNINDSTEGMFKVLTTAKRETHGGKLVVYTGEIKDW